MSPTVDSTTIVIVLRRLRGTLGSLVLTLVLGSLSVIAYLNEFVLASALYAVMFLFLAYILKSRFETELNRIKYDLRSSS